MAVARRGRLSARCAAGVAARPCLWRCLCPGHTAHVVRHARLPHARPRRRPGDGRDHGGHGAADHGLRALVQRRADHAHAGAPRARLAGRGAGLRRCRIRLAPARALHRPQCRRHACPHRHRRDGHRSARPHARLDCRRRCTHCAGWLDSTCARPDLAPELGIARPSGVRCRVCIDPVAGRRRTLSLCRPTGILWRSPLRHPGRPGRSRRCDTGGRL